MWIVNTKRRGWVEKTEQSEQYEGIFALYLGNLSDQRVLANLILKDYIVINDHAFKADFDEMCFDAFDSQAKQ